MPRREALRPRPSQRTLSYIEPGSTLVELIPAPARQTEAAPGGGSDAPGFRLGCASVVPSERVVMSSGWIVIGILVILVLFAFGAYNRLVALSQRVGQAFADIDVQLKQRHDLIPNLVETVKGYAAHERGTLDDVIKARNTAMSAQGPAQVRPPRTSSRGALGRLIALSEAYPGPQGQRQLPAAAGELSDLENKIAASAPLLQQRGPGIQHRHPADAGRAVRRHVRLHHARSSSISAPAGPQVEARRRRQVREVPSRMHSGEAARHGRLRSLHATSHRTSFVRCCCSPGLFLLIYVLVYAGALLAEVVIDSDRSVDYYLTAACARPGSRRFPTRPGPRRCGS